MSARGPARGPARGASRTTSVWEAVRPILQTGERLEVLDIGGGTGGFAVRVAELGHRVVVVDPSPDALAILDRRANELGVAEAITARSGDLDTLEEIVASDSVDLVLCHGVLEVVDSPRAALTSVATVLRASGTLSLLVHQRHAAVLARAMAGHLDQALELLEADNPAATPHRFTAEELTTVLDETGFVRVALQAIGVFSDLVPSPVVDLEPGAAEVLARLESLAAGRAEYLTLATHIHALARRA